MSGQQVRDLSNRKVVTGAAIASVLVHVVAAILTWNLTLFTEADLHAATQRDDEIELILIDVESDAASTMPEAYTAVPERLATEEPPEAPDFLALHNAQAADQLEGGEDRSFPGAEREEDYPQVDIRRESLDGAGGIAFTDQPLPPGRPEPTKSEQGDQEPQQEEAPGRTAEASLAGEWTLPDETESDSDQPRDGEEGEPAEDVPEVPDWLGGRTPSILKEGQVADRGDDGFEFDQEAIGRIGANVAVTGAFSLSTYKWDFAPWMHRFEQDLHQHWHAPYAYRLGVIHGQTQIRLVIERDGRPSVMEVIGTEGHESLHQASVAALMAFTPYTPLPPGFPEENLVIILTLHYPAWRR